MVGNNNVSTDYWRNRWTEERPGNRYPSLNGEGKTEMSSYYVEDGSYLKAFEEYDAIWKAGAEETK